MTGGWLKGLGKNRSATGPSYLPVRTDCSGGLGAARQAPFNEGGLRPGLKPLVGGAVESVQRRCD